MKTTFLSIVCTVLILSVNTVSKTNCHGSNKSNLRDSTQGSPPASKTKSVYSDSTQGSPPKKL